MCGTTPLNHILESYLFVFPPTQQVTRDYDEEEQGYDSEKEKREEYLVSEASGPQECESAAEPTGSVSPKDSKVNGDDHHEEDMDMSD